MCRNTVINLGFILATLALLALLQFPRGTAAMEERSGSGIWVPPPAPVSTSARYWEIVVPLQPRPVKEEETKPEAEEDSEVEEKAEQVEDIEEKHGGKLAPVFRKLPTQDKVIALTFDDGPKQSVLELLAILGEKDVPATFFLLGCNARKRPDLVQAIIDAGCEIANHTWSHPYLTELAEDKLFQQVENCAAVFTGMSVEYQPFMRPPYGHWDDKVLEVCASLGYNVLLWSVDSRDWEYKDPKTVLKRALSGLKPGSIVLFHDGPKVTLQVLPEFIDTARAMGYEFVLLSEYIN